jgi:hypothetical protein
LSITDDEQMRYRQVVVERAAAGATHVAAGAAALVLGFRFDPEPRAATAVIAVGGAAVLFAALLRSRRNTLLGSCPLRAADPSLEQPARLALLAVGLTMAAWQAAVVALAFLLDSSLILGGLMLGGGFALAIDAVCIRRWERRSGRSVVEPADLSVLRRRSREAWCVEKCQRPEPR